MNNNSITGADPPFRAVLFDLSGTTLDEGYIRYGLAAVAAEMASRWNIDPDAAGAAFMPVFRAVSTRYASRPFYLMSDVVCDVFAQIVTESGGSPHDDELLALEACMWEAAIPTATATDGAIETLTLLRDSGIKTGIVSYADASVFRSLLEHAGLAGLTDVELCSEEAGSCKPDTAIFLQALDAVDTSPSDALFVGDTVETDIVGASRGGMRTALLSGREFSLNLGSDLVAEHQPTHRISNQSEVVDLVLTRTAPPTFAKRRGVRRRFAVAAMCALVLGAAACSDSARSSATSVGETSIWYASDCLRNIVLGRIPIVVT
jgi:FMN phosphatase YigB (HAD superfamily)